MNKNHDMSWLAVSAGLVLGLAAVSWWLHQTSDVIQETLPATHAKSAEPQTPDEKKPAPETKILSALPQPEVPAPPNINAALFPPGPSQGLSDPRWKKWSELERKDKDFEWKTPIRFYGKVVDEEGKPVEGATVRLGWNSMKGSEERVLTSNAQGEFSVEGIQGKVMTVKPSKEGYHFSRHQNQTAFEYSAFFEPHYHVPDPEKPVVFKMVKKKPQQPLWHMQKNVKLSIEGKQWIDPVWIIRPDSRTNFGGLEISWKRTPADSDKVFDWHWRVEGKNGLLIQPTNEPFAAQAPSTGYVQIWESGRKDYRLEEGDPNQKFYFQVDGMFGLMKIEINPVIYNDRDYARIELLLNPMGKPWLEFDPSLKIHQSTSRDHPRVLFVSQQRVEGALSAFFDFLELPKPGP